MSIFGVISLFFRKKTRELEIPDRPRGFGYKIAWLAIKTENTTEILEAFANMGISSERSANWESGFQAAFDYKKHLLFITPSVNGWSFVVGYGIDSWRSCPSNQMEIGIQRFLEFVQVFGKKIPNFFLFSSHRVVDYAAWAMIENGVIKRAFVCSEGELLYELGPKTSEEAIVLKYKKDAVEPLEEWEELEESVQEEWKEQWGEQWKEKWEECCNLPHEEDVVELASKWSIDPSTLDDPRYDDNLGVGFLIKAPH